LPENVTYFGGRDSYPKIVQIDITNFNAEVGEFQIVTIKVWGSSPITSVYLVMGTDHGLSLAMPMTVVSQVIQAGIYKDVWTLTYQVADTYECVYKFTFPVTQADGEFDSPTLIVR